MTRVRDAISDVLDTVTLADMIAKGGRRNAATVKPVRKSRVLNRVSGTANGARRRGSRRSLG
jgi:DNA-binding IscR family transcriptional regulator